MKVDLSRYDDLANVMGKAIAQKLVEEGLLQKIDRVVIHEVTEIRNKHMLLGETLNKKRITPEVVKLDQVEVQPPVKFKPITENKNGLHWTIYVLICWISAPIGFLLASRFEFRLPSNAQQTPATIGTPQTVTPITKVDNETIKSRPLKIKLEIAEPSDLQIKLGDAVAAGQILADRVSERQRLQIQKEGLIASITKLEIANIPPIEPSTAPKINKLPEISFTEEEANINAADITIADAKEKVRLQERKVDTLGTLPPDSFPASIATHEQQVLAKLEKEVERAKNNKELAIARLKKAQDVRAYDEYKYSIDRARNAHEVNQAIATYEKAKAEYQKSEQERNVELANLQQKVNEVDNQLANLSIVRSPYAGTIKRLKFTGQNNNNLTVELLLSISNSSSPDKAVKTSE